MKKIIFIGLFVFSVALNLAVAATLGWHLWQEKRLSELPGRTVGATFSPEDIREIRKFAAQNGQTMMQIRDRIIQKRLELLDLIAQNPGRPELAEQKLAEIAALRSTLEKEAISRISRALAALPEDKREAFIAFIKNRTCMYPGMGMGGRKGFRGMGCPVPAIGE